MTLSERLDFLIESRYSSRRDFAKKVGINNNTVNNIINNNHSPNHSIIDKILKAIPNLSAEWLIRGIEPMWKNDETLLDKSAINQNTSNSIGTDRDEWQDMTVREIGELLKKLKGK